MRRRSALIECCWHGLRIEVPRDWDLALAGEGHLFFEGMDAAGPRPVLELRWQEDAGFEPAAALERLTRRLGRSGLLLRPRDLHPDWQALVGGEALGFSWQDGDGEGPGLLLAREGLAVLARLFGDAPAPLRVLATLSSLDGRDPRPWAVHDLRVLVPAAARLERHDFAAGRHTLDFRLGRAALRVQRFRPAAALLRGCGLEEFARRLEPDLGRAERPASDRVLFRLPPPRFLPAIRRTRLFALRHERESGALLAVRWQDRRLPGRELEELVLGSFTCQPPAKEVEG